MKKKQKEPSGLTRIFFWLVGGLVLTQVLVSHRIATAGKLVGELEVEAERIRAENIKLKEVISQRGSLAKVYQQAQSLGFKPVEDIYYLTSEIPVALSH